MSGIPVMTRLARAAHTALSTPISASHGARCGWFTVRSFLGVVVFDLDVLLCGADVGVAFLRAGSSDAVDAVLVSSTVP